MKRSILAVAPALFLAGCVAETSAVYGTFELVPEEPATFCENYADQTFYNVYNDLYDSEDGFGANAFARNNARRAADAAYERCLSGRTN